MVTIVIERQLAWAEAIARRVAKRGMLRGSHVDDLVAVAYLSVCELAERFDSQRCPAGGDLEGLFRGWSRRAIMTRCIDEARRIRAGGLIRKRVRKPMICEALGELGRSLVSEDDDQLLDSIPAGTVAVQNQPRISLSVSASTYGRRLASYGRAR